MLDHDRSICRVVIADGVDAAASLLALLEHDAPLQRDATDQSALVALAGVDLESQIDRVRQQTLFLWLQRLDESFTGGVREEVWCIGVD